MKQLRGVAGYLLGGLLFVVLMPTVMWLVSGKPLLGHVGAAKAIVIGLLMIGGLSLSIWTIIHMRLLGKGNPMDAFGHEVAPRTQHLMTDGPYRINRNPMLTGTLTYLAGWVVWLWMWQACAVWVVFFVIMFIQVLSEEQRLRHDFGEEYESYCRKSRRF